MCCFVNLFLGNLTSQQRKGIHRTVRRVRQQQSAKTTIQSRLNIHIHQAAVSSIGWNMKFYLLAHERHERTPPQ